MHTRSALTITRAVTRTFAGMRRPIAETLVALAIVSSLAVAPAPASAVGVWMHPVAGRVVHPFRPPATRYGRGHLGVDFSAAPGTPVRAAGAGTVVFAGAVAGGRHVVVRHAGGLRTSYSFLATIRVHTGQRVGRGAVLGTTGGRGEHHDGHVLHLGLRIGDAYVDPMRLFAPGRLPVRVHLVPSSAGPPSRAALVAVCGRWVALWCESPARPPFRTG